MKEKNVLLKLFLSFLKTGAFTFGGGFAMLAIIEREIVEKHKWIDKDEYMELIAITQAAPGSIAVNTATFIGYKVAGLPGALVAGLGNVLPSFVIILLIVKYFYGFRDNAIVSKVFKGIEPAVAALIFGAAYQLLRQNDFHFVQIGIILVALLILLFTSISPIYLILFAGIGQLIYNNVRTIKKGK